MGPYETSLIRWVPPCRLERGRWLGFTREWLDEERIELAAP